MDWEDAGAGTLGGIEEGVRGWRHFLDAAAYDEFRTTHPRIVGRSMRDSRGEPLPDFDFRERELVVVWSGTECRTLEVRAVRPGVIEIEETLPSFDENSIARLVFAGFYRMISLPRRGERVEIRWTP